MEFGDPNYAEYGEALNCKLVPRSQLRGHPGKYFLPTSESSRSKRSLTLCNYGLPGRPGLLDMGFLFFLFYKKWPQPQAWKYQSLQVHWEGRPDGQRSLRRE